VFGAMRRDYNDAVHEGWDSLAPRLLHMSLAATFPNLRTLDLTACCVPHPRQLGSLRPLRLLRHISIKLPEFGVNSLLEEIAALSQLTSLDLSGYVLCWSLRREQSGQRQLRVVF
jgi:hypothetical protein